jgi:L-ascorbate metabolism protein UlaG (beta-lactamase superfamily)
MSNLVTLKSDVVIEPLIERWYAWSHLVSPATAALNVPFRHLTLLESFVSAPDIHAAACKNPSLRGGPFVDLPVDAVDQVRDLIAQTKKRQEHQIAFGEALKEAYRMVLKQADGFSIEKLYQTLPTPVRGYVELFYTVGGHPDLRVIEPMLYRSPAFNPASQSALIYQAKGDDRSFAFSTPRLPRQDAVELERPFTDKIYDYLAALRLTPQPLDAVLERLAQAGVKNEKFRDFLTDTPPQNIDRTHKGGTRWRYFGHACILVQANDGTNVLVDPIVAYETSGGVKRFVLADLPERIDYVVLTHNHADHVLLETLLALRYKIDTIVVPTAGGGLADPSLKLMLQSIGFKKVIEIDPLGYVESGDMRITALPFLGEHGDLDIRSKAAWLVKAGSQSFLFAADSNNLEPFIYEHLRQMFGPIETLFIGQECQGAPFSWTYGPLLPFPIDRKKDQTRRLNGSDAVRGIEVVKSLGSQTVYVYAMGAEPWLQYVTSIDPSEDTVPAVNARQLVAACQALGLHSERLFGSADVTLPA